jgi:hypothetical protein
VSCAEYAIKHNLIDIPGRQRFRRIDKSNKRIDCYVDQTNILNHLRDLFRKFGVVVVTRHAQAIDLKTYHNNTKWQEAGANKMTQLLENETFIEKGKDASLPMAYKRICCHMTYDVKHDGR